MLTQSGGPASSSARPAGAGAGGAAGRPGREARAGGTPRAGRSRDRRESKALSRPSVPRWTRSCTSKGSVRSNGEVVRHHEEPDLAQPRRAVGGDAVQPRVVAVAEADALAVLDQLDPVEDAAADVSRALEGIGAVAGDQERAPARARASRPSLLVGGVAEQAAADRRHGDRRDVELDEAILGVRALRMPGGSRLARVLERLADLADGELQAAHRAVADEALPVAHLGLRRIERALRRRGRGPGGRRRRPAGRCG